MTVYAKSALVGRVIEPEPQWAAHRRAVGDRLRNARRMANHTQEGMAERSSVSRDRVKRVERGDSDISRLSALWRLSRAVGVPIGELRTDRDET